MELIIIIIFYIVYIIVKDYEKNSNNYNNESADNELAVKNFKNKYQERIDYLFSIRNDMKLHAKSIYILPKDECKYIKSNFNEQMKVINNYEDKLSLLIFEYNESINNFPLSHYYGYKQKESNFFISADKIPLCVDCITQSEKILDDYFEVIQKEKYIMKKIRIPKIKSKKKFQNLNILLNEIDTYLKEKGKKSDFINNIKPYDLSLFDYDYEPIILNGHFDLAHSVVLCVFEKYTLIFNDDQLDDIVLTKNVSYSTCIRSSTFYKKNDVKENDIITIVDSSSRSYYEHETVNGTKDLRYSNNPLHTYTNYHVKFREHKINFGHYFVTFICNNNEFIDRLKSTIELLK